MPDALADRLPDGILIVRDGRIVDANDRAHAMLGRTLLIGDDATELLDPRDDAGLQVRLPAARPLVGDRYAERVLHVATGVGRRPMAFTARWDEGELILTMRSAGRREAAVRGQSDIVATVAHEIRSPLTSVKGFTRTLLSRWDRFSDEQKHTMLMTIEADADRVTRLLTDLLDVARIDAGRVKLRRTEVSLRELVQSVIDKAMVREPERRFEIEEVGELRSVLADADKLEQVFTNLIDNAILHAPGSSVRCVLEGVQDGVRVRVIDQGPGIRGVPAARLFTKFGRGRSEHRSGTGLGLYVTRGLVEAHGGTIGFDPEVTSGAAVEVWLPAAHR